MALEPNLPQYTLFDQREGEDLAAYMARMSAEQQARREQEFNLGGTTTVSSDGSLRTSPGAFTPEQNAQVVAALNSAEQQYVEDMAAFLAGESPTPPARVDHSEIFQQLGLPLETTSGDGSRLTLNPVSGQYEGGRRPEDSLFGQIAMGIPALAAAATGNPLVAATVSGLTSATQGGDLGDVLADAALAGGGAYAGGVFGGPPGDVTPGGLLTDIAIGQGQDALFGQGAFEDAPGPSNGFADSQGNPSERPQIPDQPIDNVLDSIEGLLDGIDPSAIKIPIPGLPFPIPGSMTWEDLWGMAQRAGKSVAEILAEMGGNGQAPTGQPPTGGATDGSAPPVAEEEEPSNWWDIGWSWEDEQSSGGPAASDPDAPAPGTPGATPQEPNPPGALDGPPPEDPSTPGADGSTDTPGAGAGAGAGITLPFLLPLFMQDNDRPRDEFDLWDYQGPDQSYGYQTPDYGTPTNQPLFDWERQPGQPIQVAPNVQPRNEFLTPAEKAMRRRQQLEGLLG